MITYTSSSNSLPSRRKFQIFCLMALLAGALALVAAAMYAMRPPSLLETLQGNFDRATRGEPAAKNRMAEMPPISSAGLECVPAQLTGRTSRFRLVLPKRIADRKGFLAAIGPDGSLREIYISYGDDTDPEDLIIPSRTISWQGAHNRNSFQTDAMTFEALVPGTDTPQLLFRNPGVYQFALMNGSDRELLDLDKVPFRVKFGCVVNWQP